MHDLIKAVVPQEAFDLVWDKQTHEGFAQFRRDRFESTGHLESNVIQHTVRLVVGERDLATRHALRDRPQRGLDGIQSQVHGDTDPREHRRTSEVESCAYEAFSQGLTLEINGSKDEVVRDLDTEIPEPVLLPGLRSGMIDLEDPQTIHQIAAPVAEGIQARAKDHVLLNATADRPLDHRHPRPRQRPRSSPTKLACTQRRFFRGNVLAGC